MGAKNSFATNAFGAAAGGISQTAADARYVLKAAGSFTGLTGAGFRDTSAAFDVTLGFTSSSVLTAGRALTIDMGNVAHTIALGTTANTITFPNAASFTVAGLGIAQNFTAANIFSVNGATSAPAVSITGTVFSGGTGTTTKPLFMVDTGTACTNWNTQGAMIGANAPAAMSTSGYVIDLQYNNTRVFSVNGSGTMIGGNATLSTMSIGSTGWIGWTGRGYFRATADGVFKMGNDAETSFGRLCFGPATSGFTALKANTTTLQCKLADDSAYAAFDALSYKVGGTAGASGSGTVLSSITVTNGIVTAISIA